MKISRLGLQLRAKIQSGSWMWGVSRICGPRQTNTQGVDIDKEPCCIDVRGSPKFGLKITHQCSPCLTYSRAKNQGFYITSEQRMFDIREMCRLQGFPDNQFDYQVPRVVQRRFRAESQPSTWLPESRHVITDSNPAIPI